MIATNEMRPTLNLKPFIIIMSLAILAALGGIMLSTHAVKRHGTDAQNIRRCLENQGPSQVWKNADDPDILCFVVDTAPDCQGILIAQVWNSAIGKCTMRERTSFTPGSGADKGQPGVVRAYLERAGFIKLK